MKRDELIKKTAEAVANYLIEINTFLPFLEAEQEWNTDDFPFSEVIAKKKTITDLDKEKISKAFFEKTVEFVSNELKRKDFCKLEADSVPVRDLEKIATSAGVSITSFPEFFTLDIYIGSIQCKHYKPKNIKVINIENV